VLVMQPGTRTSAAGSGGTANADPKPVRLLTLTTLFPNAQQPRHGIFVASRMGLLCASGRIEATVIAALPRFPGYYRATAHVPSRESVAGLEVYHPRYLHWPGIGMRRQPFALARALLAQLRAPEFAHRAFDAIDAHYFYPDGVAAAMVAKALGLPLAISARGTDINLIPEIPFARRRMIEAANQAKALIAVSQALKDRMAALGMPSDRIHVLRNGVDMTLFAPVDRSAARARLELADTGTIIAGVGNLVPEKGFDLLIEAAADSSFRLLLVGDGPERASLCSLADRLAPGRVEFRGNMPQADLRYVYSAANVLALPSLREGWPNVLLEAIACGTPVVAAGVGGVREIIGEGAPGAIVASRAASDWKDCLGAMARAAMRPEAVRAHASRFSWDEVVDRQCALYESISARHTTPVAACSFVHEVRMSSRDLA
jgi:glycosyltransferase involved in cell wall biosynthesis